MNNGKRCMAIGVVPATPFVMWDYDLVPGEQRTFVLDWLTGYANARSVSPSINNHDYHRHWVIRETGNGFHLVIQCESWDVAQDLLNDLYSKTKKQSILNCRKQRLRVSPKWDAQTGETLNHAPKMAFGCAHSVEYWNDIKKGRLEFYYTYERGLDTGMTEADFVALNGGNSDV